jgi:hypothetical protein
LIVADTSESETNGGASALLTKSRPLWRNFNDHELQKFKTVKDLLLGFLFFQGSRVLA